MKAEESAWLAFPERLIRKVEDEDEKEIFRAGLQDNHNLQKEYFCHFYRKENHYTETSELFKAFEAKG